jgi:hypothetical protein
MWLYQAATDNNWNTHMISPVKEYELLDTASSLHVIRILHIWGAQIPTGHLVQ